MDHVYSWQYHWLPLLAVSILVITVALRAKVKLIHSSKTVLVGKHNARLSDLVRRKCPSLTSSFVPTWYLPNGHLQTIFTGAASRIQKRSFAYKRENLILPDGGVVAIDWASPQKADLPAENTTPILLLLHGLGGGSYDKYILDFIPFALDRGFVVAAFNSRGCGGIEIATPQLYSGSWTQDVRLMVDHVHTKFPHAPLVGVGFSLGANIMTKLVGEDGESCKLAACISVANPYDLQLNQVLLHTTWLGKELYSRVMANGLKEFYNKHASTIEKHSTTTNYVAPISSTQVNRSTYLAQFDDAATRRMFGYRSVYEYYRSASSAQWIPDIRVPTLFLSDLNDPIAKREAIPIADIISNPFTVLALTKRGGHLGWFEGVWEARRWYPKPILEFAAAVCESHSFLSASAKRDRALECRAVDRIHAHYTPHHLKTVFPHHLHHGPPVHKNAETTSTKRKSIIALPVEDKPPAMESVSSSGTSEPKATSATIIKRIMRFCRHFALMSTFEAKLFKALMAFVVILVGFRKLKLKALKQSQ